MRRFSHITFICAVLCFISCIQAKVKIHIPASDVQSLREHAITCEKETGVPAAVLKQVIDWPLSNDEPTKKFFFCICNKIGYADNAGHATVEKLGALQVVNGQQEDYINKINECNKITLDSKFETVYAIGSCLHDMYIYST